MPALSQSVRALSIASGRRLASGAGFVFCRRPLAAAKHLEIEKNRRIVTRITTARERADDQLLAGMIYARVNGKTEEIPWIWQINLPLIS